MNITTNDFQELLFNGLEVDNFEFNGDEVWQRPYYGVEWTTAPSGDNNALTRIGLSKNFSAPNPYYSGMEGTPSSPFDTIAPWSGMTVSTMDGNSVVSIPKFYYKLEKDTTTGRIRIRVSNYNLTGFRVSPAHRDRGDGEKSVVYVGRYHSGDDYTSKTGVIPISRITRAQGRAGVHALGTSYWQFDFSMLVTIWLLYLVEFANWNSQILIGYGCGNSTSKENTGSTDLMPYHTGTMLTSKTTYGVGIQYRYIEDPWANVFDWCDGICFNATSIYCFEDLADYSDDYTATGATLVGTRPNNGGYIQDMGLSSAEGFEWFMYSSSSNSQNTDNIPDYCSYGTGGTVLTVGGGYNETDYRGFFTLSGSNDADYAINTIGTRLMVIPGSTRSGAKATENFRKNPISLKPQEEEIDEKK